MKRYFLLLCACFAFCAYASGRHPASYRYWDGGALTWKDFQDTIQWKGIPSKFKAGIQVNIEKTKHNNQKTIRPIAKAFVDRAQSFASDEAQNENTLRYYQAQFDLLELYRRRLQAELNTGLSEFEADNQYKYYMELFHEQEKKMAEETLHGANEQKLQEWEFYVGKELAETPIPDIPTFIPRSFGYGLNIGGGISIPAGNISDFFTPAWQFNIGLDLAYKRLHLFGDIGVGTSGIKQDIHVQYKDVSDNWRKGLHTTYSTMGVTVGYDIISTRYFALTPFAGGARTCYSRVLETENRKSTNITKSDFNWTIGLNFDYRFSSIVSMVPSFFLGHREMFTSSLRTRIYLTRGEYNLLAPVETQGYQIGVSIMYSGFGNMIKIR